MQRVGINLRIWLMLIVCSMMIEKATGLVWGNCSDPVLRILNAKCASLSVPLDYDRPEGETLQIAVARISHNSSASKYQGVMFAATGEIAGTGVRALVYRGTVSETIAATYDWVGFDTRGTGLTGPILSCVEDYYPARPVSVVPYNRQLESYWLNRSKHYVEACRKKYASVLPHINSLNTVRDMEQIRKALKADKLHMYAHDYGTYISQLYATIYPKRVGRMVLHSPVDSERVWYQRALDKAIGTQRIVNQWYEWVAKYDDIYHLGTEACQVEAHINDVLKELDGKLMGGSIGQTEWIQFLTFVTFSPSSWSYTAQTVAALVNDKDNSQLLDTVSPYSDKYTAVALTKMCNDRPWPRQWDTVRTDLWRTYTKAPLTAWTDTWLEIPCIYWPYRNNEFVHVNGRQVGDILLITGTDAATYRKESIMDIRRHFPRSRLISVVDGTADYYAFAGNTCVDETIYAYLTNGTVPSRRSGNVADVECARAPLPVPTKNGKSSREVYSKDLSHGLH